MSDLKSELEKIIKKYDKPRNAEISLVSDFDPKAGKWFPTEIKQGDDGAIRFETEKEKEK